MTGETFPQEGDLQYVSQAWEQSRSGRLGYSMTGSVAHERSSCGLRRAGHANTASIPGLGTLRNAFVKMRQTMNFCSHRTQYRGVPLMRDCTGELVALERLITVYSSMFLSTVQASAKISTRLIASVSFEFSRRRTFFTAVRVSKKACELCGLPFIS